MQLTLKRDCTSQRDVASIFSYGRFEAVQRDPVQGCAWRLAIIASGSPKVDSGDQMNLEIECSRLSDTELASAKACALAIGRTIAAGGEPKTIPAAKGKKQAKELDGEAEPLSVLSLFSVFQGPLRAFSGYSYEVLRVVRILVARSAKSAAALQWPLA